MFILIDCLINKYCCVINLYNLLVYNFRFKKLRASDFYYY